MKLHIYAQQLNHDSAWIVGDKEAFLKLRAAIDKALADGNTATEVESADGEGYSVYFAVLPEKDLAWENMDLPYTDRSMMGFKETRLPNPPHDLISIERHKELRAKLKREMDDTLTVEVPPKASGEYHIHMDIPVKSYKAKARVVRIDRTSAYNGPSLDSGFFTGLDDTYEHLFKEMKLYLSFEPGWDGYTAPVFKEDTVLRATNLLGKLVATFKASGDIPDQITPCPFPDGRIDLEVIQRTKKVVFAIDDELETIEATIFGSVPRVVGEEEGIAWFS